MTMPEAAVTSDFLTPGVDPNPVDLVNSYVNSELLLVCEHAGLLIPKSLKNLGLSEYERGLHIACDIGTDALSRALAQRLQCRLIVQRYSRLVIDCNRPTGTSGSIPQVSDGIAIPGNADLSQHQRLLRENAIFEPYAQVCHTQMRNKNITIAVSIHSFTPRMNGKSRPWDIGFLFRHPCSQGQRLVALCRSLWPELVVGENVPYCIEDSGDWFIPICAESRGIRHCLIEIRNDHLRSADGLNLWANRLSHLILKFMEQTDVPQS